MITEATASDYGVEWALLEDALINTSGRYYSQQFGSTYNPGLVGLQWLTTWPDQTPVFTDIDALEFKLDHFSNNPLGYSARWQWEASGRGRIVPEPGALVLVVIASLGWPIKAARSIRNPGDRG